eukprot:758041-Hanusia_phi.AAC.1
MHGISAQPGRNSGLFPRCVLLALLLLGLGISSVNARISDAVTGIGSLPQHGKRPMTAEDVNSLVKQVVQGRMKAVKHVLRNAIGKGTSFHKQHHAVSIRSAGASDSMYNMTACNEAIKGAVFATLPICMQIFSNDDNVPMPNTTVLDGICSPTSGCLSLLQNFSIPTSLNATCPANYSTAEFMQTSSNVQEIQQNLPILCLKKNGVYCILQIMEVMNFGSETTSDSMVLDLSPLCSSPCFQSIAELALATGAGMDAASFQLAWNMMCMTDSKGNLCYSSFWQSNSEAFYCTECGAKMLSYAFGQGVLPGITDQAMLEMMQSMMKVLCMKDGSQYCIEKYDEIAAIQSAGPACLSSSSSGSCPADNTCKQAISQAQSMGCCAGSMLKAAPEYESTVLNIAKACSLTIPAPCTDSQACPDDTS